jgi:hypothetical protein
MFAILAQRRKDTKYSLRLCDHVKRGKLGVNSFQLFAFAFYRYPAARVCG